MAVSQQIKVFVVKLFSVYLKFLGNKTLGKKCWGSVLVFSLHFYGTNCDSDSNSHFYKV